MRVQHIEQALRAVYNAEPPRRAGLEIVEGRIGRLRHLIWNGYHEEARRELYGMRHMASEVVYLNGEGFRSPIGRLLWNCDDLWRYLTNNIDALINYGARRRSKLPISTLRAEGCVDEIANARMARKQRMRWSPRGAHCVATVRAAVLDGQDRNQSPPGGLIDQKSSTPSAVHALTSRTLRQRHVVAGWRSPLPCGFPPIFAARPWGRRATGPGE